MPVHPMPTLSQPRRGLSIQQKLAGVIVAVVVTIVAFLAIYLSSLHIGELQAGLLQKATTYGMLVSKQVESAVAFRDRETAREVFEAISQDSAVEAVVLYTSDGNALEARGSLTAPGGGFAADLSEQRIMMASDYVLVVAPVVSLEGPRGVLALQLSTEALDRSRMDVVRAAALAGGAALVIGILASFVISRSAARRLRAMAETASAVAAGDLDRPPLAGLSTDEIGTLAAAFNVMVVRLKALIARIQADAHDEQARLERLVRERTSELDDRNRAMRLVLDNVVQGLLTIDKGGVISSERSSIVDTWFGPVPAQATLGTYLEGVCSGFSSGFDVGWSQVVEDTLPQELTLAQLPTELRTDRQIFELEYRPITGPDGQLDRVLVVISDVTAIFERKQAEEHEREIVMLFTKALEDRAGVTEFLSESQQLIDQIVDARHADPKVLRRWVHTLKGNAGLFGLTTIADICHAIESDLGELRTSPDERQGQCLRQRWHEMTAKLAAVRTELGSGIQVDQHDYDALVRAAAEGATAREIHRILQDWKLEPLELRFRRIAAQIEHLAQRLGRGPVEVQIEASHVRTRPERWAAFWSAFAHVVRNAVDHGLEPREERIKLGKPEKARIDLRGALVDGQLKIEIEDGGRGVNWDRLRATAKNSGISADSEADLVEAMFTDGISARERVSETSGRGVGLSAVRSVCHSMGGRIQVDSKPGKGTRITFLWPAGTIEGAPVGALLPQSAQVPKASGPVPRFAAGRGGGA